jgi:hypothetical protein
MSPIEHVWDALDLCVQQRVPVHTNIQQLCTAIEEEWDNVPQATISLINTYFYLLNSASQLRTNSYLQYICEGEVSSYMRQMVVTPDTDWFSDPLLHFFVCICFPCHVKSID